MAHAPLLTQALSPEMGRAVIEYLSGLCELPPRGCIAGQSVMSALMALYATEPLHAQQAPIKDIDVFFGAKDALFEDGFLEEVKEDGFSSWCDPGHKKGDYDRLFDFKLNIENVFVRGKLNLIELAPGTFFAVDAAKLDPIDRLDIVLSEFDLSLVQVGVDLESGQMRWTPGFDAVCRGEPVKACAIGLAERTWMRYVRKHEQMPWLSWDHDQIRSTCQLHQAKFYALISEHENEANIALSAWSQSPAVSGISELKDNMRIKPVWEWPSANSPKKMRENLQAMLEKNELRFTAVDKIIFDFFMVHNAPKQIEDFPLAVRIKLPDAARRAREKGMFGAYFKPNLFDDYVRGGGSWHGDLAEVLFEAIDYRNLDMVEHLIVQGVSPNVKSRAGVTAYMAMCSSNNLCPLEQKQQSHRILHRMRQGGADVTLFTNASTRVMHQLVMMDGANISQNEVMWHLHHRDLLDGVGRKPWENLMDFSKDPYTVSKIEEAFGVTEKEREEAERKKRFLQFCRSGNLELVQNMLKLGQNPNHGVDVTPLFAAAYSGHARIVQALVERGADLEAKTPEGRTALMAAASEGSMDVLNILIDAGANVHATDAMSDTALSLAIMKNRGMPDRVGPVVNRLVDAGANPHQMLNIGTRLMTATSRISSPEVVTLMAQKIKPFFKDGAYENYLKFVGEDPIVADRKEVVAALDSIRARTRIDALLNRRMPQP